MKIKNRTGGQLELTLSNARAPIRRRFIRRPARRQRALWWFQEMHRVVDDVAGPGANVVRPEQDVLALMVGA
jgi:hypothetical protein